MKRNTLRLLGIIMTLALVMSMAALSAFAVTTYTAIPGTTTTFEKNLVVESDAAIPAISFDFTIAAGTPVPASSSNMEILAGPTTASAPTVSTATFASTDSTTDGTPDDDTDTAHKYATQTVTVDFTGVQFDKPGVYRYVITENATSATGVTNDANPTRYLDVFVVADPDTDVLSVSSYALRDVETNIDLTTGKYETDADKKSNGYTNEMESVDLEFKKTTTGNQADKNKKFVFTLDLSAVNPGTYTVEITGTDVVAADATNQTTTTLVVPANATSGSYTFSLADGETVKVYGLPEGYGYELSEVAQDYTSTDGAGGEYTDDVTGSNVTEDVKTGFTNTREGIIPTGVIITIAPFVIGILVFGAIMLYMVSKRRRAEY